MTIKVWYLPPGCDFTFQNVRFFYTEIWRAWSKPTREVVKHLRSLCSQEGRGKYLRHELI